ncbi:MAG TPA: hypothetical protein VIU13_03620 [Chryseolinea sp.]
MKKLTLTCLVLLLCTMAFAQWGQDEMPEKPSWRDRMFVGGGLGGLSFSSYSDYFGLQALVGYKITPKLAGGVQLQYRFTKYKQFTPEFTTNDYSVAPFLRFNFYGPLFLHAEYEYLNYENFDQYGELSRFGFNSFMAGGGFFQPVGRNAGFFLMALYNFSYQEAGQGDISPYNSPFILRAGITAGF